MERRPYATFRCFMRLLCSDSWELVSAAGGFRAVGTIRRECLDCGIPVNEGHLRAVLRAAAGSAAIHPQGRLAVAAARHAHGAESVSPSDMVRMTLARLRVRARARAKVDCAARKVVIIVHLRVGNRGR
jgi:hypothetical protein